ncbi:very short patch repair endonuclease [uncultured Serinicoccus sp.]|uniref:very short patch repair endonuclease n=1 Tax=uncultured Serinicoccus sp. TaxID=735514 RepID=UPI0026096CFA|nr:very short patch repair endonuclease [uncultured Serinicoccus sp.]
MTGWESTASGRHLGGRRSKDTQPELLLRRALHAAGARFRLHRRLAKGCTPDLVLPGRGVAVCVDGDYWHGCPKHFPNRLVQGPNASLWAKKFAATRLRDERATALAENAGWTVVRVWECEVREAPDVVATRVLAADPSSNT